MTAGGYYEDTSPGIRYDDLNITDGNQANIDSRTNEECVVVYNAIARGEHLIPWICWSYSDDPAQGELGRLRVQYGTNTVFDVNITAGGAGFLPVWLRSPPGTRVRVRLAPVGAGITGKLNVGHRVEREIG